MCRFSFSKKVIMVIIVIFVSIILVVRNLLVDCIINFNLWVVVISLVVISVD